jgi:hypothetical protein
VPRQARRVPFPRATAEQEKHQVTRQGDALTEAHLMKLVCCCRSAVRECPAVESFDGAADETGSRNGARGAPEGGIPAGATWWKRSMTLTRVEKGAWVIAGRMGWTVRWCFNPDPQDGGAA